MECLISVVMPMYNAERFVAEAIESVLNQTHATLELLIVDDCATDGSLLIAKQYEARDGRVHVIQNVRNQGVSMTRNTGIMAARGEYIALLDSDDVWAPQKLEKQLALLLEKKAQLAYCSYDFLDENGAVILRPFLVPETTDFQKMLYGNDIGCSTVLIEASFFKKHLFTKEYYHEDYALWMEMLQEGIKAVGLAEVYVHYRKVAGSRSDNKWYAAKQRWRIFRDKLKLPLWKSGMVFVGYAVKGMMKHYGKRRGSER